MIEALDNLLTPHEGVELILETRPMNDSEYGCLGIVNVTDDRIPGTNLPDRLPRSSPGEWAYRKSRLQNLQAKIKKYQPAQFAKTEAQWFVTCLTGFKLLAAGLGQMGFYALASAGFELPEAARARLIKILQS